jgi:enamine deaminase RidA (YjgF/YER057c/UK114 family)
MPHAAFRSRAYSRRRAPLYLALVILWGMCFVEAFADKPRLRHIDANEQTGRSDAVVVGQSPLLFTTQILPVGVDGKAIAPGRRRAQIDAVLARLEGLLEAAGASNNSIVKLNVVALNNDVAQEFFRLFAERRRGMPKPALCMVTGKLPLEEAQVALDAVVALEQEPAQRVQFDRFDAAVTLGAEGHAARVQHGVKVYVSGQAERGQNMAMATQRTLESLAATLEFLKLTRGNVIQVKSFLAPMSSANEARRVIEEFFGAAIPPLVFVEWTEAGSIEIELIADGGPAQAGAPAVEFLTPPGMQTSPIFSRVSRVSAGQTIYISGLHGRSTNHGQNEVSEVFAQLDSILRRTGGNFTHLAKATYYVSTEEASRELNAQRPKFYDPQRPPAASKAVVAGTGAPGKTITLDMIAVPAPTASR